MVNYMAVATVHVLTATKLLVSCLARHSLLLCVERTHDQRQRCHHILRCSTVAPADLAVHRKLTELLTLVHNPPTEAVHSGRCLCRYDVMAREVTKLRLVLRSETILKHTVNYLWFSCSLASCFVHCALYVLVTRLRGLCFTGPARHRIGRARNQVSCLAPWRLNIVYISVWPSVDVRSYRVNSQ